MRNEITKEVLKELYDRKYAQAGDTELDFYEWAIDYLLENLNCCKKD
jgi:hypothetical protein